MTISLRHGVAVTALGGALGALVRWALTELWPTHGTAFPWTVLAINVVGSALLAFLGLLPVVRRTAWLPPFLGSGVMGGFTTMSTASTDTFRLLDAGALATGLAYALGTLACALVATGLVARLDPLGEAQLETDEGDR